MSILTVDYLFVPRVALVSIEVGAKRLLAADPEKRKLFLEYATSETAQRALQKRAFALVAYINANLGGLPEDNAAQASLDAAMFGGSSESADVVPVAPVAATPAKKAPKAKADVVAQPQTVPTPVQPAALPQSETAATDKPKRSRAKTDPAKKAAPKAKAKAKADVVAQPQTVPTPAPVQKGMDPARAQEIADANTNTPASAPQRIVPPVPAVRKVNGVTQQAHDALANAHPVCSSRDLGELVTGGWCFVTGKRLDERDVWVLVNQRLLTTMARAKEFSPANRWWYIRIGALKDLMADFEAFMTRECDREQPTVRKSKIEARISKLKLWQAEGAEIAQKRMELCLLNGELERVMDGLEDELRSELQDQVAEKFPTRKVNLARQKAITARKEQIKDRQRVIKHELGATVIEAEKKTALQAELTALSTEWTELKAEFDALFSVFLSLPDGRANATYRAEDVARPAAPRPPKKGKEPKVLSAEEQAARQEAAKLERIARKEAAEVKRRDPHFGEVHRPAGKKQGEDGKKGKGKKGGEKSERKQRGAQG